MTCLFLALIMALIVLNIVTLVMQIIVMNQTRRADVESEVLVAFLRTLLNK